MSGISVQYQCRSILESVFKCNLCGCPLLMFGCDNPQCNNFWKKNLNKKEV